MKEITCPWIDYPALSTSKCVAAIRSYLRPFFIGRSHVLSRIRVAHEQPYYCYIITVSNQYETRSFSWKPQHVSDNVYSSSPSRMNPWDMHLSAPSLSEDSYRECEIPDSVIRTACPYCSANSTNSTPKDGLDSGKEEAPFLSSCSFCKGSGVVEYHKMMRADFKTETFTKYLDCCGVGVNNLRNAKGILEYSIKGNRLHCRQPFLDDHLNQAVSALLDEVDGWSIENQAMIRSQQLCISVIPVKMLECIVGNHVYHMTVYDIDSKVVCPEFSNLWCSLWRSILRV